MASSPSIAGIDLYWLPLGAGGHSVRLNGKVFEAVAARLGGRERCDLYHSALEVRVPEGRFVIEQAPAWSDGAERGVVARSAVWSPLVRSARARRGASGSFATRSAVGATASSPMSPRRSRVRTA
jgi:hypothetical protein